MNILAISFLCFLFSTVRSVPIYNDLVPFYKTSDEVNKGSERSRLFMDNIIGLASFLLKNVSKICPLDQPDYFQRIEKIVLNTLAEVYENEETLEAQMFYQDVISPTRATLENCLNDTKSRISLGEYNLKEYPETILHIDLKHRTDISTWQDFRPCIRTQIKSNFYPGILPSTIDTLWQTFLLGYMGCTGFWGSVQEWKFLDLAQQVIIRPIFQRWNSKIPTKTAPTQYNESPSGTISTEILDALLNQPINHIESTLSLESISAWLEKCNVILFLRHSVDPVPCFRDVILR